MLSIEFLRNSLPESKDFTISAGIFLPVGNGVAGLGGEDDKTARQPRAPDATVVMAVTRQSARCGGTIDDY